MKEKPGGELRAVIELDRPLHCVKVSDTKKNKVKI